jgi:uncharacterized protein (DUF2336 family)
MRYASNDDLIEELNHAITNGGDRQRLKILERVTELFAAGSRNYSGEQIALFEDILQELSSDIEVEAGARLSYRLAHLDRAPPKLIRRLAFDDAIAVAEPVLMHSEQLSDADLVENARTKSQKHLLAIARRLKVSEPVTDVLVECGNQRVLRSVVKNRGARFSLAGYGTLTTRARYDRELTLALGARGDLPRQMFLKLLEGASASVRRKLECINPQATRAIRETIDDIATVVQQVSRKASDEFAAAAAEVKRRNNVSPLGEANVHAWAHAQEFERTVIALSRIGNFSVDLVERALLDKGAEMVLILGKAAGCSWTTTKEMLLMFAAERQYQPDDLSRAFEQYQKLSERTARKIIRFYEARAKLRPKPSYDEQEAREAVA